ncbi:MAG: 3-oxoacyl-ACP reductase FabG [Firmicutes bacterium]|nr:3-oxoacyl-ACP reductase FabG [Bacillota bacterium]
MLALVTGASKGIGRACALELAKEDFDIIVHCSSDIEGASETAAKVRSLGRKAHMFAMDLSDPENVHNFCGGVLEHVGLPDAVVNNAGVCLPSLVQDISLEDWDYVMNVNLKAAFIICRDFAPAMIERKSGSIVNIASIWGRTGSAMESSYCASKGALVMFSKALAQELGPSGIRVNCVSPGCIDTAMNASYSEDERRALEERTPLGRFGSPEEVGKAVAFLASEKASFITGADLLVDGGFSI